MFLPTIQGCEGSIESLTKESVSKLTDGIHAVCKLAGEPALATDTPMVYMEQPAQDSLLVRPYGV